MAVQNSDLTTNNFMFFFQTEISNETISEIKKRLLTSLEHLKKLNDEKQLIADLWCHFGKILVYNVDEGNNITCIDNNTFKM